MRKSERTAKAWDALLKLVDGRTNAIFDGRSIRIFYRGVDEAGNTLYEVISPFRHLVNVTEEQLKAELLKGEANEGN